MRRHVLDDAEHGHVDLFEHLQRLARIEQGNILRRGDDHRTGYRHALAQGQLDVAGAGRQIDDQIIEIDPIGVAEQLLQGLGDHRPAPDHRRVFLDQEADRHDLDAVVDLRLDATAILGVGLAGKAEHAWLARPVDVGIENADAGTLGTQGQGQVGGDRRLADAALARGYRNHVADVRHRRQAFLHPMRTDAAGNRNRRRLDRGIGFKRRLDLGGQRRLPGQGRIAKLDIHRYASIGDTDATQGRSGNQILPRVRIIDRGENFPDSRFNNFVHGLDRPGKDL